MAHPYHHALSSVKKWGGTPEDYLRVHQWFDESKMIAADFRHRALRHHAEGIFMAETIFGATITISTGRTIPVRWIGEQHVREDLGFIPSFVHWLKAIRPEPWMGRTPRLDVERDVVEEATGSPHSVPSHNASQSVETPALTPSVATSAPTAAPTTPESSRDFLSYSATLGDRCPPLILRNSQ